jgi:hypothetical protein
MTQEKRERVIDRIRKIMAKANDAGVTQEEAATFAAKAQELLEANKLAMTDIEFAEYQASDPIKEWRIHPEELGLRHKKTRQLWSEQLMASVARAHMCEILVHPRSNSFTLIGRQQDVEVATYMYQYLYRVCEMTGRKSYGAFYREAERAGNVTLARGFLESFRAGFVRVIRERYDERRRARERMTTGTGVALVRISDELARAQEYLKNMGTEGRLGKATSLSTRLKANDRGFEQGRSVGRNVNLDSTGIKDGGARRKELT